VFNRAIDVLRAQGRSSSIRPNIPTQGKFLDSEEQTVLLYDSRMASTATWQPGRNAAHTRGPDRFRQ